VKQERITDVVDLAQIELEPGADPNGTASARSYPDASGAVSKEAPAKPSAWRQTAGVFLSMVSTLGKALLMAFAIRVIVFEPFHIPSESMEPTLFTGDIVGTTKFPYGWSRVSTSPIPLPMIPGRLFGTDPRRGDVIMFRNRLDNNVTWVKRVIGLPGDRVQMRDGILNINGVAARTESLGSYEGSDQWGRPVTVRQYREDIPQGCSHYIQHYEYADDTIHEGMDDSQEFLVPLGHYFLMGDNRDASSDSRWPGLLGYVAAAEVIGRAQFTVVSLGADFDLRDPQTWTNFRQDRTLKNVSCQ